MQAKFILRTAIIATIFFTTLNTLRSCSCFGEEYFCHEILDSSDVFLHPKYIFKGIKLQDTLHGMFVRIERQYINEIFEDTILIWGDPGNLCRVYTSNFEIGDTIILGINRLDFDSGMPEESIGDYWLPACGVTFLKINNGVVEGAISMGLNAMPVEDFDNYMDNKDYESECMITGTKGQNQFDENSIKFYPNPTHDLAFISCENCEDIDELTIYNSSGQVKNIRFVKEKKMVKLDLEGFTKGIYFIKIRIKDRFKTYKFLII